MQSTHYASALVTRARSRVFHRLANILVQSTLIITDERTLDYFLGLTHHSEKYSRSIRIVDICFDTYAPPTFKIRLLLSRTKEIDTLSLSLAHVSISRGSHLLHGLHFISLLHAKLVLPHGSISQFLRSHSHIISLSLCRKRDDLACPLWNLPFPLLSEVTGPLRCISRILPGKPVTRVCAELSAPPGARPECPSTFKFLTKSTSRITVLELKVPVHYDDLLSRISEAAPFLSALKLTISSTRPDASALFGNAWISGFQSMTLLKSFLLKCNFQLGLCTPPSEAHVMERRLVFKWAGDESTCFQRRKPKYLDRLVLWYHDSCRSRLSRWGRRGNRWTREYTTRFPSPEDFC